MTTDDEFVKRLHEKYGPPPENITFRCVGLVVQAGGSFRRVKWIHLDRTDRFTNQPELLALKKGDRFEAMVTRRASDWKFLSITDVKLEPEIEISQEESEALWNSVMERARQNFLNLPTTTWD